MYDNIGSKIKTMAIIVLVTGIIASLICGVFISDTFDSPIGLFVIIGGSISALFSSYLIFGFGEIIEKAGYWCGIYANDYWWRTLLKGKLDRFTKWVAHYSRKPSKSIGKYDIWQYSSTGVIPGINEEVDMNICYRNFPKEIRGDFSETKPKKSVLEIAKEVIDGLWGNGAERKEKLNAAGYDVKEVQNKVNELLK